MLKLQPLDAIDTPPGAADRGTLIHDSIGEFAKTYPHPGNMPDDPVASVDARSASGISSRWRTFPRRGRSGGRASCASPNGWRASRPRGAPSCAKLDAEIGGSIEIPFGGETFKLTVRADRIEHLKDGRYAMLDYKTGAPPSEKQVRTGLSPQLTLEAAILRRAASRTSPPAAAWPSWSMCGCAAAP